MTALRAGVSPDPKTTATNGDAEQMANHYTRPAVPTLSAWQGEHRRTMREASRATPSQRGRTDLDPRMAVLLCALAATAPAIFRPGEIAEHTGLSPQEVVDAIADLEDAGLLENGSAATGRLGIVTPLVLAALGVAVFGLSAHAVRADVAQPGPVELSEDDMAEAFASACA